MAKHIGIAAVSPEGSALCYRQISRAATAMLGDTGHPRVTLHNEPFEEYMAALERSDWHHIGEMLLKSAKLLATVGAEFVIIPDNLMQHAVHLAEVGSPIPWLTMTDMVANKVAADGRKAVGVIGTKQVMFGSTYQTHLGLKGVKVIAPEARDADALDQIIFRELVHGEIHDSSRQRMIDSIQRLQDRGAEGVVLACTEAPLLVAQDNSPVPVYDTVQLLAEGAVRYAVR